MIPKSRQLATAVQLQPVQSGPVSSLFAVLWTGLLNSSYDVWHIPQWMVVGHHLHQKWPQTDVTISQVMHDGQEELYMEIFMVSNVTETEA